MHVDDLTHALRDEAAAATVGVEPDDALAHVRRRVARQRRTRSVALMAAVVVVVVAAASAFALRDRTQTVEITPATRTGTTESFSPPIPLSEALLWTDQTVEPNVRLEFRYRTLPTSLKSAPLCGAADLAMDASAETAAGVVDMIIAVRNVSTKSCSVSGWPPIELVASDGSVVQTNSAALSQMIPPRPGEIVLVPGSSALLGPIAIGSTGCGVPQSSEVRVTLPYGAGVVKTAFAPGRLGIGEGCIMLPLPTRLSGPPFISSDRLGIIRPVDISMAAPATVHRGHILVYEVTMTNPASPGGGVTPDPSTIGYVGLGSCPLYRETLGAVSGTYLINCSKVVEIDPGQSVGYEMRLALPSNAPLGRQTLTWDLLEPDLPAVTATITITN